MRAPTTWDATSSTTTTTTTVAAAGSRIGRCGWWHDTAIGAEIRGGASTLSKESSVGYVDNIAMSNRITGHGHLYSKE